MNTYKISKMYENLWKLGEIPYAACWLKILHLEITVDSTRHPRTGENPGDDNSDLQLINAPSEQRMIKKSDNQIENTHNMRVAILNSFNIQMLQKLS